MSAAVLVESTPVVVTESAPAAVAPGTSAVLAGHDALRERELDLMAANIESAAEGLGIFLLLALFGTFFVIATLSGVFA